MKNIGQFNEIWEKSSVGVAVLDERLRYEAVNCWLARVHGIPPERHVGKHLRDIIGDLAAQVEPALRRVLLTGRPVLNVRSAGMFPRVPEGGRQKRWLSNYFPVTDGCGSVRHVAAIVVELGNEQLSTEELGIQSADAVPPTDVLRSWKEIAGHMQACVKTVQRWERSYGLPVRRLVESKGSIVYALRAEIDSWMQARTDHRKSLVCSREMEAGFIYSTVPVLVIDDERIIVQANIAAAEMIRTTQEQLMGKRLDTFAWNEKSGRNDYEWNLFLETGLTSGILNLKYCDETPVSVEYTLKRVDTNINVITFAPVRNYPSDSEGVCFQITREEAHR